MIDITALPEPASMFKLTSATESTLTFSWEEQFDGFRSITGARLEYTEIPGNIVQGVDVGTKVTTITGLKHSTFYTVALFIKNPLGRSSPVYLVVRTRSPREF